MPGTPPSVPTILITGPPGVGKSTILSEVSWVATGLDVPHGGIDTDMVAWVHPTSPNRHEVLLSNVAAVWRGYQSVGATHLILAHVLHTRAELEGLRAAIPGAAITVFRLRASLQTLLARLGRRELGGRGEASHIEQARGMFEQMDRARVEDRLIDTKGRGIGDIGGEIIELAGWKARDAR